MLSQNWPIWLWFCEVDDLFRWNQGVCLGLDLLAIEADAKMSERSFTKLDYQGLRVLGKAATAEMNKSLINREK